MYFYRYIYIHTCIHTYIHTYIHKWTSCMAFKLWNTVELVIGPRPSLLFREIPFNFEFEIFVERNVRCIWNSRITAGNHIPYFEALKKMQGLFKSTENHILACLLHLQLHAPLFLYHASAQPPRRHSKNIRGGLARAGASAKQQQGYMSFTVKFIHTCIHTYIQSWKFKLTLFVFLT